MDATANNIHKTRADTLAQIAADILMHGLPAPTDMRLAPGDLSVLDLRMDNEDRAAVDAWAKHLGLGEPVEYEVADWIARKAEVIDHSEAGHWMGWHWVKVWCSIRSEVES